MKNKHVKDILRIIIVVLLGIGSFYLFGYLDINYGFYNSEEWYFVGNFLVTFIFYIVYTILLIFNVLSVLENFD